MGRNKHPRWNPEPHEVPLMPDVPVTLTPWPDAKDNPPEVERLTADLAVARAERDGLAKALADAIECVESWGVYADEYFRVKHDLDGDLARLRAALAALPTEPEQSREPRFVGNIAYYTDYYIFAPDSPLPTLPKEADR